MLKFKAFTLAEVLITLGIIGIVTALTIPALIQNYNTKQWDTAANVFEKKLDDAIKIMNSQSTLAGYTTTEDFVEELSKHFKINKICSNQNILDCFPKTVYWGGGESASEEIDMSIIKTARNLGQTNWKTNVLGVQFANGVSALIAYNPLTSGDKVCSQNPLSNQINGNDCYAILYDTSGDKTPNTIGKDLRANANVSKLGTGCAFEIGGACYSSAAFVPTPLSKAECEAIVAEGEYGIKTCSYDNDYWAGAVKACGGIDNLPTSAQLTALANYLYNKNDLGTTYIEGLTMDMAKYRAFNFVATTSNHFYIWTKHEKTATTATYRHFNPRGTGNYNSQRNSSTRMAWCLLND